jgi:hypothetical protein
MVQFYGAKAYNVSKVTDESIGELLIVDFVLKSKEKN